ncbi:MAG: NAD kinase [Actinomycetaceae bacterium]|nr:NAD kinase [Actinomycetaceae bacterium]
MMRKILLQKHPGSNLCDLQQIHDALTRAGITPTFRAELGVELVLAVGGDGTVLSAAEVARELDVPLIGINSGHMGFLTEAEPDALEKVVENIVGCQYTVENRMTLEVTITHEDGSVSKDWALNEVAALRTDPRHPCHFGVGIDGQRVSKYGADGMIVATPTGSTAYAFSAGGPIVWPDVQALVMVPLAAHGLFTQPVVVSPASIIEIAVLPSRREPVETWCDGKRNIVTEAGATISVTRSDRPVRFARINDAPFSSRLVAKFDLPVHGWRDNAR